FERRNIGRTEITRHDHSRARLVEATHLLRGHEADKSDQVTKPILLDNILHVPAIPLVPTCEDHPAGMAALPEQHQRFEDADMVLVRPELRWIKKISLLEPVLSQDRGCLCRFLGR